MAYFVLCAHQAHNCCIYRTLVNCSLLNDTEFSHVPDISISLKCRIQLRLFIFSHLTTSSLLNVTLNMVHPKNVDWVLDVSVANIRVPYLQLIEQTVFEPAMPCEESDDCCIVTLLKFKICSIFLMH